VNLFIDPGGTTVPVTPNLTLTNQNLSTNAIGSEIMFAGGESGASTTKTASDFGELYVGTSYYGVI
jgi:hypothetical protein